MDQDQPRSGITPGMIFGLIIIALGVILLLDRQGVIDARTILRYWPAALIAIGLARLFQADRQRGRGWGLVLAAAGTILLLNELDVTHLRVRDVWPLFLIAAGVVMLWHAIEGRQELPPGPISTLRQWAAFGGNETLNNAKDFHGGELTAIFGGCKVDLRQAEMASEWAVIYVHALFGGIELIIPEAWEVVIEGAPIFGGFADKTRHPRFAGPQDAKRLVIRGYAMFGGVEIRN
jgi:predicted membrane protein